ncbi:MAG: RNA polymerase sigma-54 factor [Verrucomicrobia bacterium]|nr:RNA polymerase sigma-54 factor [Verrucomicrobiota bacterium]
MQSQRPSLLQSQQLQMILAPQLRQSLEMLQLPILELRTMIQKELEQNPTIEEVPESEQVPVAEEIPVTDKPATPDPKIEPDGPSEAQQKEELNFDKDFEALAKLDEEWRDYFFQDFQNRPFNEEDSEKRQFLMDSLPQRESLQEHLISQLTMTGLSESDKEIAELIIGSINDDGYLATTIEELAASSSSDVQHLADILLIVQEFHPTGVGCRDLRECLLIQLERQSKGETLAAQIVRDHLDKLGARKLADIAKALKVSPEEINQAAKLIATLDPKPGRLYSEEETTYIFPEIVVQKVDGEYVIMLNDDELPHIRISNHYRQLLSEKGTQGDVKSYVRERIRAGAFLIKSIHQRQKTIHRIASEIVSTQKEFFDKGISALKPLTMSDVAKIVGVHETTVSRAVSGKYMQTPMGIIEMKYFFTPGIKTADGKEVSNMAVKDMIANIVSKEDLDHPASDQEIMEELKKQGINIARRTIAKYRLMLHIPPSHLRK